MAAEAFEKLVELHYEGLYRFAFSLCRDASDAADLTQQTFLIWARKGEQLRDSSKAKTWLFTALYREFLGFRRKQGRLQVMENSEMDKEWASVPPDSEMTLDAASVMDAVHKLDETYRVPLVLFYIYQNSYKEIADILGVPIGTVMSRLSRAKSQVKKFLELNLDASDELSPFFKLNPSTGTTGAHENE